MVQRKQNHQILLNIFFALVSCVCIIPFLLLFISSITDEAAILKYGYSFFPQKFSPYAYDYLMINAYSILRAYGITVIIAIVGTSVSLLLMSLLAYPLSRKDMPHKRLWTFFVFFTMLFNGGLVATYLVYTQLFHMKNTIFALIIPVLLMRAFYVLLIRTFFITSIPDSIIEAAHIDGAGEWLIFYRIVLPVSIPVLATVGLFQTVNYWNDWFNGMIYITDSRLYSIQNLLNRILLDIQFLTTNQLGGSYDMQNIPQESVRMALAVIGIVPILAAYPFFQKYFVKGLTIGAVKG
ncbi:MAG: sugar ABC transporter permease [Clostridiales bacterium GWC2_40_7]|nr:MAG: sugar ABC transporter permease [Clostridiales bacterium GWC2_40_7]